MHPGKFSITDIHVEQELQQVFLCGSSGSAILSHCGRGESCGLMRALLHTLNTLEQLLRVQACPSCQTSMASPQRVPWPLMPAWVQHTPCRSCQVFLFSTPHMQQSFRGFFAPFSSRDNSLPKFQILHDLGN